MRIGIDGRELLPRRTGVGRYLLELCRAWSHMPRAAAHEFLVYTPEADAGALPLPAGPFHHRVARGRTGTAWEQLDLPRTARADGLDRFFAPAYSAPLRLDVPTVVAMHDVSFAAHPEWFPWREGLRRRWLARLALRRAAAVVTISEFSRAEIARCFDVPPERLHVVYPGVRAVAPPPGVVPARRLVLSVGSIFNRRHLPTLLRAFGRVRRDDPEARLVIVGDNRTYPRESPTAWLGDPALAAAVSFRDYVSDEALGRLYAEARVFAFLSEYEGFGLPPLEAMAAGVPVVAADTAVAREVYGDAACLVPVADASATARGLHTLLTDDRRRARLRARAEPRLRRYRWGPAADRTLSIIERAGARGAT